MKGYSIPGYISEFRKTAAGKCVGLTKVAMLAYYWWRTPVRLGVYRSIASSHLYHLQSLLHHRAPVHLASVAVPRFALAIAPVLGP